MTNTTPNTCRGRAYASQSQADLVALRINQQGQASVRTEACSSCGRWHVRAENATGYRVGSTTRGGQ